MMHHAPVVEVVSANREDDVASISLKVVHENYWPATLMPAGLYLHESSKLAAFQLHKLVRRTGDVLLYETYEHAASLPNVGEQYFFKWWWMLDQLEAVIDQDRTWVRRTYPDNGTHVHCLLTWETISAYTGQPEGYYFEPEGDWLTVDAYETYITRDIYRLRQAPLPVWP